MSAGAASPPAGGAAIGQVVGATLGVTVASLALLWVFSAEADRRAQATAAAPVSSLPRGA